MERQTTHAEERLLIKILNCQIYRIRQKQREAYKGRMGVI